MEKLEEVKKARDEEKEVAEREVEVNKRIAEIKVTENNQLREEIKQVKLMLKIPRMHFKNIETSDWENLKTQYDDIMGRMDKFGQKN